MDESAKRGLGPDHLRNQRFNLCSPALTALHLLVGAADYPTLAELMQRPAPEGLTGEQWEVALRLVRSAHLRPSGLGDAAGAPLFVAQPARVAEFFHEIDRDAAATAGDRGRDRRVARAARLEAIAAAGLSGETDAAAAAASIRTGHPPVEAAARAAFNHHAMLRRVGEQAVEALTVERVREWHAGLVDGLDAPALARTSPAENSGPLEEICRFANAQSAAPTGFLHPFTRAVLLLHHVAEAKVFPSANDQLARLLFVWLLRRAGYARVEEIAVSEILQRDRAEFDRARSRVATDAGDVTHLLLFLASAWRAAVQLADERGRTDASELAGDAEKWRGWADFNPRQQALLVHALKAPETDFLIAVHQRSHGITHETARTDLFDLEARGLLHSRREGRAYRFRAVPELGAALRGKRVAVRPPPESDEAMPVNLL